MRWGAEVLPQPAATCAGVLSRFRPSTHLHPPWVPRKFGGSAAIWRYTSKFWRSPAVALARHGKNPCRCLPAAPWHGPRLEISALWSIADNKQTVPETHTHTMRGACGRSCRCSVRRRGHACRHGLTIPNNTNPSGSVQIEAGFLAYSHDFSSVMASVKAASTCRRSWPPGMLRLGPGKLSIGLISASF